MVLEADIIVKTGKGLENIVASRVEELGFKVLPKPLGLLGLVLVRVEDKGKLEDIVKLIEREIPEAEKVLPVYATCKADLNVIAEKAAEVAKSKIKPYETFAVRTVRRGKHSFTSIDVNVKAGARVKEELNLEVDLEFPDKIIWVEILGDTAFISITPGTIEWKKKKPGKPIVLPIMKKISVLQMPYTGPLEAVYKIGVRLGRGIQTFEIGELVVTPKYMVTGEELLMFLRGLLEGISSRYEIQKKCYAHKVHKVPVYVHDLFQAVRDRRNEPLIATSTKGEPIGKVIGEIAELVRRNKRINILVGAREGLPSGVLRYADLVIDVAPGITLPTDYAAPCILEALIIGLLGEEDLFPKYQPKKSR